MSAEFIQAKDLKKNMIIREIGSKNIIYVYEWITPHWAGFCSFKSFSDSFFDPPKVCIQSINKKFELLGEIDIDRCLRN